MKKQLLSILAATALSCGVSQAVINVQWSAPDGFLLIDDATGLVETLPTAWVQLIYTPVFYASVMAVPAATPGGGVSDGHLIVDAFSISDAGGADPYGTFVRNTTAPFAAGWWYARVFEGGSNPAGNIVENMYYYQSALYATIDNMTPDNPDVQNIQGNNPSSTFAGFGDIVNRQVVPEPSTLAFLGIGGLALALRRRFVA